MNFSANFENHSKFHDQFRINISDFKNVNLTFTSTYLFDVQIPKFCYKPFKTCELSHVACTITYRSSEIGVLLEKRCNNSSTQKKNHGLLCIYTHYISQSISTCDYNDGRRGLSEHIRPTEGVFRITRYSPAFFLGYLVINGLDLAITDLFPLSREACELPFHILNFLTPDTWKLRSRKKTPR